MTIPAISPFATWRSPLTPEKMVSSAIGIGSVTAHSGRLYWIESRPLEQGRDVLVAAHPGEAPAELLPAEFNCRSRVHEYGGRAYAVVGEEVIACAFADQRLHLLQPGGVPRPMTPPGYRYADAHRAPRGRTLYAVREDHTGAGEPRNSIVALDVGRESAGRMVYDRSDFVACPRVSPDGRRIVFVAWNHPEMPWDGTMLHVGEIAADGSVAVEPVAGGAEESIIEPAWDVDGTLYFLSDRNGFWNLHRLRPGGSIEPVTRLAADLGGPLWRLGDSTWALTGDGRALVRICEKAIDRLAMVDLGSGSVTPLPLPFVSFGSVGVLDAKTGFAVAAPTDGLPALVSFELTGRSHTVVRSAGVPILPPAWVSRPESIEFPVAPGPDGAPRSAHGFFHAPWNPEFDAPPGSKPPLIVLLHGGPTGHASAAMSLSTQFWTTRGFAVVVVNYGGSSGFGRAYRNRLRGAWGVLDRDDAVAAVDHLAAGGRVDGGRAVIRGGSAGGFTVLASLAFTRRFAAGINYFGVSDLEALAADTHKFESRYLDRLVAPLPAGRALYRARSPIHHLDSMSGALITFQGSEDKAVPPSQSRRIVEAVRHKGLPVAYIEFAGEQHGFRQAANIARALGAELDFLGRVLGFTPADPVEAVEIANFPASSPGR